MRVLAAVLLLLALAAPGDAADSSPPPADSAGKAAAEWESVKADVSRLLDALDDDHFERRQHATRGLSQLVERPELSTGLAAEFERRRQLPQTSFEVRAQLAAWLDRLPEPPATASLTVDQLQQLVAQLDNDNYAIRSSAADRLATAAANPQLASIALAIFKKQLALPGNSIETQRSLEPLYERAQATWLASDPAGWNLPAVSDEQIAAWLNDLTRPAPAERDSVWLPHHVATRELLDLLARDEYVPRLKAAFEQRLADGKLSDEAADRLKPLWEWTRPALVAEIWHDQKIAVLQHLLVGVPQQPALAPRPTFFDRIDDRTAHCVSGNSLAPGNYPVGIALPRTHPLAPSNDPVMFHLINLPTPRQRMIYQRFADTFLSADYSKAEEVRKLVDISKRSLNAILADKRLLAPRDIDLLLQLDSKLVSRFAADYFKLIDDRPCPAEPLSAEAIRVAPAARVPGDPADAPRINVNAAIDPRLQVAGNASQHGLICVVLAAAGTSEAGPTLLEAMRAGRISAASDDAPYQLPWIAALAIAARDPWADADVWLASLLERTEPLKINRLTGAELGAVAAAILISRRGEDLADLGFFAEDHDPFFAGVGCRAVRFASEEKRQEFLRWWAKQQPSKAL